MLKKLRTKLKLNSQKGIGLVETLMAVAILGTAVVAFVAALSVGSLTASEQNRETTAQGLAQTQMEYTKNYPYAAGAVTYPALTAPATYSVTIAVVAVPGADTNIQKVTVTVFKEGISVLAISDYKVKR